MNSAELLLIAVVAIIVFGPNKIPMLAEHLGKVMRLINQCREKITVFWQMQINEQQLKINEEKAAKVDQQYIKETEDLTQ